MFLFSKLVVLSSLTLGTIGLSSYLIPLFLKGNDSKINSLFKDYESLYSSKKSDKFDESEKEILKKLNNLFGIFDKAVKYSDQTKNEKSKEMNEFLDSTSIKEVSLINLYKRNLEILDKLLKLFDEFHKLNQSKILIDLQTGIANHKENLVKSLEDKLIKPWKQHINEFICLLDRKGHQENNENCINGSANIQNAESEGGAVLLKRDQVVRMLGKH